LLLTVGVLGLASHQPLLIASLGPTVYEQVEKPLLKSSRFYNVVVGHWIGLAAGFASLALLHVGDEPSVVATGHITALRVWACVIAAAVTTLAGLVLRASQPAALSTTLLVALGPFQTRREALIVIVAVLLVAVFGEPVRQMQLRRHEHQNSSGQKAERVRD
jgi:hypothetical protein